MLNPNNIKGKTFDTEKNGYSKDVKASIIKQIQVLENRIEEAFTLKLDGNITHDFWKSQNDKWRRLTCGIFKV